MHHDVMMHHDHAVSIVAPGSQPTWNSGPLHPDLPLQWGDVFGYVGMDQHHSKLKLYHIIYHNIIILWHIMNMVYYAIMLV